MTDGFFRDWPKIIWRSVYELALPLVAGAITVAWAWWKKSSFVEALSAFGIGYLFVISVQGMVLRVAKNVRDEDDADEFRDSFASIRQAITELKREGLTEQSPQSTPPTVQELSAGYHPGIELPREYTNSAMAIGEASKAASAGLYRAAVAMAAIAFERAVKEAAERAGIDPRQPLSRLVRQLATGPATSPLIAEELLPLVRLRNGVIHSEIHEHVTEEEAIELIRGFVNGTYILKHVKER